MVRTVALVCLLLGGGVATAAEPSDWDPSAGERRVREQIEDAVWLLQEANRKFGLATDLFLTTLTDQALARLDGCDADLKKAHDVLRAAVVEIRALALLSAASDCPQIATDYYSKLADRVQRLTGDKQPEDSLLQKATAALATVRASFAKPVPKPFDDCAKAISLVLREATDVWAEVRVDDADHLRRMVIRIRESQERMRWHLDPPIFGRPSKYPRLGPLPEIVLPKRARLTVQHTITWGQYEEDTLLLKLSSSDPSIVVPSEIKLDFEKHQFRFEYEIKVGNHVGEFTVTLTPEAGKPVVVKVTVK